MCEPDYKYLPCNSGYCPFGSGSMEMCKQYCGLCTEKDKEDDGNE